MIWKLSVAERYPKMKLKLLATDSDPHMLERAQVGRYPASSLKDLPRQWQEICFDRADNHFTLKPQYRQGVQWSLQDLRHAMPAGPFDLIMCRHLAFTYFDEVQQRQILAQFASRLILGGLLVTGKQESVPANDIEEMVAIEPLMGIYRRTLS